MTLVASGLKPGTSQIRFISNQHTGQPLLVVMIVTLGILIAVRTAI